MSDPWDVATWVSAPSSPYRINTFYRVGRAVVTLTGELSTTAAAADLRAGLLVFETLAPELVVDVCHARLDAAAADTLARAGQRRRRIGFGLFVDHADAGTRVGLRRAAEALRGADACSAEVLSIR